MTLRKLKNQLRLELKANSGDEWGTVMGAFFKLCEFMYATELPVPSEWGFKPGLSFKHLGTEILTEDHEMFQGCTTEVLQEFGNYLNRKADKLERQGSSY